MTTDRTRRISRNWGITTCAALALAAGSACAQSTAPREPENAQNNENQSASDWYSQSASTGQYVQPSRGENAGGTTTRSTTVYQQQDRTTLRSDQPDHNRIYGSFEQQSQTGQSGWQSAQMLPQLGGNDLVLVGEKNNKTAEILFDNGQLISYTLDGKTMPLNKVQAQGNRIRVLDESNQVCSTFNLPQSITSGRFNSGQSSTQADRRYSTNDQNWRDQGSRDFRSDNYQSDRMGNNDHYQPGDTTYRDRSDTDRDWNTRRDADRSYNQYDRDYRSDSSYRSSDNNSSFDRFYGDRQDSYSPSRSAQNYQDTYRRDTYRDQSYPRDQYTRDQMNDQYNRNSYRSDDNRVWNPQTQSWEYRSSDSRTYQNDRMYDRNYNRDQSFNPQRSDSAFQQNRIYGTNGTSRPMVLGIMMEDADQSQINSTQYQQGVKVTSVQTGLPADTAGLKQNDIIVMVDNQPATVSLVRQTLQTKNDGDSVNLKVLRDNQPKDITVKLSKVDRKMYNWDYMGDIQKSDEFTDTNIENLGHPGPHNNYRPTQPEPNYGDQPKSGNRDNR